MSAPDEGAKSERRVDDLRAVLLAWLESEREAYLTASRAAGFPPSVALQVMVATAVNEHQLTANAQTKMVSPLAVPAFGFALTQARAQHLESTPAAEMLATFGEDAVPWTPFYSGDVTRQLDLLLDVAARDYLAELPSLEVGDEALAEKHVHELLTLLAAEIVDVVTAVPVGGIKPPTDQIDIAEGNLRLRALTPEEIGRLADHSGAVFNESVPRRTVRRHPAMSGGSERVALEVRVPSPKNVQPLDELRPARTVLALQLLGFELHGTEAATTWTEPGPNASLGHPSISLARTGEPRSCSPDDLGRAMRLAAAIPEGAIWTPQSRPELVLHRFKLGVTESSPVDALVDYVVALESFLLGEKEGEYRFKFGLFGARYLGADATGREAIACDLRQVYDVRSAIVHGKIPNSAKVAEVVSVARDLTSRMIVKALEAGWPSHDALRRACYG